MYVGVSCHERVYNINLTDFQNVPIWLKFDRNDLNNFLNRTSRSSKVKYQFEVRFSNVPIGLKLYRNNSNELCRLNLLSRSSKFKGPLSVRFSKWLWSGQNSLEMILMINLKSDFLMFQLGSNFTGIIPMNYIDWTHFQGHQRSKVNMGPDY